MKNSTSIGELKHSKHSIIDLSSVDTSRTSTSLESSEKVHSKGSSTTNETLDAPGGGNIVSDAIRSITSIMVWQPKLSCCNDNNDICPICLEPYKEGEKVCRSTNQGCTHSFHLGCMMKWLMMHDDCPLCRTDYMNLKKDKKESGTPSSNIL